MTPFPARAQALGGEWLIGSSPSTPAPQGDLHSRPYRTPTDKEWEDAEKGRKTRKREQIAEKDKMSASLRAHVGREGAGAAASFRVK